MARLSNIEGATLTFNLEKRSPGRKVAQACGQGALKTESAWSADSTMVNRFVSQQAARDIISQDTSTGYVFGRAVRIQVH